MPSLSISLATGTPKGSVRRRKKTIALTISNQAKTQVTAIYRQQCGLLGLPPQFFWYCECPQSDLRPAARDSRSFPFQPCQVNQKVPKRGQDLTLRREELQWTRILRRPTEPVRRAGPRRAKMPFVAERCSNPYPPEWERSRGESQRSFSEILQKWISSGWAPNTGNSGLLGQARFRSGQISAATIRSIPCYSREARSPLRSHAGRIRPSKVSEQTPDARCSSGP